MEPIPYTIVLKAPAFVRVVDCDRAAKRAYLSAIAVRSQMRRKLKLLIDEYGLTNELEFELFGELRPDGYARASVFQISGALTEDDISELNGDEKCEWVVLPAGTTLIGHLRSNVPTNSLEGLAVFMSLIGINSLNAGINSNDIDCEVTITRVVLTLRRYTRLIVTVISILNEKPLISGCQSCVGQLLLSSLVARKICTACPHEISKS